MHGTRKAKGRIRAAQLFGCSALFTIGFAIVSRGVRRGRTRKHDQRALDSLRDLASNERPRRGVELFARASKPLGKWYGHMPPALVAAYVLERRHRTWPALTVLGSSVAAVALSKVLDRSLPLRPPPPERQEPWAQSYPSGHSLETTAVALAGGYVLVRERVCKPWVALPLAVASAASGLGRFAMYRHWASDLVGGYCAGIALGTASAGAYELALSSE